MASRSRSALMGRPVSGLFSVLSLSAALSGCVGNDSDPPVLSVDLVWDSSADDRFFEGDCYSADVASMSWQLKAGDKVIAKSDDPNVPCESGFDFVDVGPGNYDLAVQGFDSDQKQVWGTDCTGLVLERFDILYRCKVPQPAPQ
jgi:hypothetical protein